VSQATGASTTTPGRRTLLQMSTLGWWVAIGLVPQSFFWIWYTIVFGALFGIVAAAIARRRGTAAGWTAGRGSPSTRGSDVS
jgi:hypothetical protein